MSNFGKVRFTVGKSRNERERNRVKNINDVLGVLKEKLPEEWQSTNMSKLEIIRKTASYIRLLTEMANDGFEEDLLCNDELLSQNSNSLCTKSTIHTCQNTQSTTFLTEGSQISSRENYPKANQCFFTSNISEGVRIAKEEEQRTESFGT